MIIPGELIDVWSIVDDCSPAQETRASMNKFCPDPDLVEIQEACLYSHTQ